MNKNYGSQNVTDHVGGYTVSYPKGSRNPQGKIVGGFGAYHPCEFKEVAYTVTFPDNFDWVKGGKLHGIYFGQGGSGGKKVSKGSGSVRLMWRANGAAEVYVYREGQKQKYGESIKFKQKFSKGKPNTVLISVTPESVQCALNAEHLTIPGFGKMGTGVFYSTFFGGSSKKWEASKDEKVVFTHCVVN